MFQFIGYDAFSGPNALNYVPTKVENITKTRLSNAIFDHFNVTYDVDEYGNVTIPDGWTYDTVLDANFNGNIDAGNLEGLVGRISGIKIKRRLRPIEQEVVVGLEPSEYDWVTLKYYPVSSVEDFTFTFNDFLNAYGVEYDYALVPVIDGAEGQYIISTIVSKFHGVFIGDSEQAFKFLAGVSYGSNSRNQQVGTFMPLGKQFPIIVANGILSYESGSVSGTVLNDGFEVNGQLNNIAMTRKKNALKDYLTNKKPKILKDSNGNIWLVMIVDNAQVSYREGTFMSVPQVQFNWTEVGKANNQEDLYDNGLVDTPVG